MLNLTKIMFDGVSQAMDHVATNLLHQDNYFRLQASLHQDSLDDVSETNLNALHAFADSYFNTMACKDTIKKLTQRLKACQISIDSTKELTSGNGKVHSAILNN